MADVGEVQVNVENGPEFLADEVSISHSPIRFVIDFKSIVPRMDLPNHPPRTIIKHNVVMVDAYFAKELLNVLKDNIAKYEHRFGEIKKPEALRKYEKDMEGQGIKKIEKQDYFG